MDTATRTDNRLQNCPRLRQAFAVPGVKLPEPAPVVDETPAKSDKGGLGELFGQMALEVIFRGLALTTYPLKKLGGRNFDCHKVQLAA